MSLMRRMGINKVVWAVFAIVFLCVLFSSLFSMTVGMDTGSHKPDCPFMSHEEVICGMNMLDHLTAWKSTFTLIAPTFVVLLLALGLLVAVLAIAPNFLLQPRYFTLTLSRDVKERIYTFFTRPLQQLFARGILHPKLF